MTERRSPDAPPERDEKSTDDEPRPEPTLKAPKVRIGEGAKNLRQRREWFQRRSGSDK
jgi:hypothetical protein